MPIPADWTEFEDDLADAIADSIDMDWNSSDGAKAVVRWLNENAPRKRFKMLVGDDWLRRRIEADPDLPCEAGVAEQ